MNRNRRVPQQYHRQATGKVDAVEEEGDEEPARDSALGTLFWHGLGGVKEYRDRSQSSQSISHSIALPALENLSSENNARMQQGSFFPPASKAAEGSVANRKCYVRANDASQRESKLTNAFGRQERPPFAGRSGAGSGLQPSRPRSCPAPEPHDVGEPTSA